MVIPFRALVFNKSAPAACFLLLSILLLLPACGGRPPASSADAADPASTDMPIRVIDLIHLTHTDYGYTDHPLIAEELHKRYLDIAVEAVLAPEGASRRDRFHWTAEALDTVASWWKEAGPGQRRRFLKAVGTGRLEITALPFNVHPFFAAEEAETLLHWIPDELWRKFNPRVAVQNDVNGFPRVLAAGLLERGVRYLWTGINAYWGTSPLPRPSGFWWRMPGGGRLLVWLAPAYWEGYNLFASEPWRFHGMPKGYDTRFRPPRPGDILASDETSVRAAHKICLERIEEMVKQGYAYDFLTLSITNQWRIDNDPPFPALVEFVSAWNALSLQPRLNLTTAAEAMARIENLAGDRLPEFSGEWPDWWSFGFAATPGALAASRRAARLARRVRSPLFGALSNPAAARLDEISRLLCRFSEHTAASNESGTHPYGLFNLGQVNEKQTFAFRPMAMAEWLLAQRIRSRFSRAEEGIYILNPTAFPFTGWTEIDRRSFRGTPFLSLTDAASGKSLALHGTLDGNTALVWMDDLPAHGSRRFFPSLEATPRHAIPPGPDITLDGSGWPLAATWPGMPAPLFSGPPGGFESLRQRPGAEPRDIYELGRVWLLEDAGERRAGIEKLMETVPAVAAGRAEKEQTPHTLIFRQSLSHPRIKNAERVLEISRTEPRATLHIRFFRISSEDPEIFFARFTFPELGVLPVSAVGGEPFLTYRDQIPGSCRDFLPMDGWLEYAAAGGHWIWTGRDTALVAAGDFRLGARRAEPPENPHVFLAMLYNNIWEVNFLRDRPGGMEFRFDLAWRQELEEGADRAALVDTLELDPPVFISPAARPDAAASRLLHSPGGRDSKRKQR